MPLLVMCGPLVYPGLNAGEDVRALLLLRGQGDRLPVHSPRVTESLSS